MAALETILQARALAKQGNTQRQVAQIMGISQASVMRYIKAANRPELQELIEDIKTEQPDIDDTALIGVVLERQVTKQAEVVETLSEDVKTQRSIELERLDGYTMVLEGMINSPHSKWDQKLRSIDMALKVHDRRSKYLGLDTPFKYEGSSQTSIVVNGVDMGKLK
jgi:predicted transcriptional regulator